MYRPEKFVQSGAISKDAIQFAIKRCWEFVKFKEYCNVLEVGCGPGNCTRDLLVPLFPKSLRNYVATDLSTSMIEYAQKHYQNDPRIKFKLMDITTDYPPKDYENLFDHVLSFQCFQFISDQRKALRNMYHITKIGGSIFITFPEKVVITDLQEKLSHINIWKPYFQNYKDTVSPTQFCEEPRVYFESLLKEVGFSPIICETFNRHYVFLENIFLEFISFVCMHPIPEDLVEDYTKAMLLEMERRGCVCKNDRNENCVILPYNLLIVYATKTSNANNCQE